MTTTTRRTLFEISSDLLALDALLSEREGDITDPEVAATIDAWFAELSYDEAHKLESWCGYVAQLEMEAERARVEAAAWHAKARSRENRMAWLRARMLAYIESSGRSKVVTASGRTLSVQQNGGKAPLVIPDEHEVLGGILAGQVRGRHRRDSRCVGGGDRVEFRLAG